MKHHIVAIDAIVQPPELEFDHDVTIYNQTTPDQLPERIKDATIVITTNTWVTRAGIEAAPNLQLIGCNGTGHDRVDKDAVRNYGITLCNVPAQNTDSVSEHAFALYFAVRRKILPLHAAAMEGVVWARENAMVSVLGAPGRTNSEETLVVVGYGALGRRIEQIGKALGMNVLIAERKGATEIRKGRIAFEKTIDQGTVFIISAPLEDSTRNAFDTPEFEAMDSSAIIINVGRGGIVNEQTVVKALRDGQIGGAAFDVFVNEPATKENCPLLDPTIPNLVVTPHVAWFAARTLKGNYATVKRNLEAFAAGKPVNVVIAGTRGQGEGAQEQI